MKKLLKNVSCLALVFSMFIGFYPTATQASESQTQPSVAITQEAVIDVNLDSLDLSKPYTKIKEYKDAEGNPYTLEMKFTPNTIAPQAGSSTNPASVGTWTSSYDNGIISHSYQFDLSKSGAQWVISNARNHAYTGIFISFRNPRLYISRATSTASFPAEVNASVEMTLFDNQWVKIYDGQGVMYTQVTSGGTMTLHWD